jgi:hypothetical protein
MIHEDHLRLPCSLALILGLLGDWNVNLQSDLDDTIICYRILMRNKSQSWLGAVTMCIKTFRCSAVIL